VIGRRVNGILMLFGAALARLRRMAARFRQVFPHFADGRLVAMSAILALFVLLHVIWFIRVPDDLDAFNFVLALRQFDVTQHRPHPPGAPVFVALGKASAWVWQSLGMPADSLAGHEPASLTALSLIVRRHGRSAQPSLSHRHRLCGLPPPVV
jgi:hypothetical protein